jgi:DNA-binding CsgD family transcriptional regulator
MTVVAGDPVELAARLHAHERVQEALAALAELGPVSEIVERAPGAAATAAGLDRVLLSRVHEGRLLAEALHAPDDERGASALLAALAEAVVALEYPLAEAEVLRQRRPRLLADGTDGAGPPRAFGAEMGWGEEAIAPVLVEGRVVGFLHGDRLADAAPCGEVELDALWSFARGFALVFERAILRRRLRVQREEMRRVASWADARTSELSDAAMDLGTDRVPGEGDGVAVRGGPAEAAPALRDLLTRREIDVLELMVQGGTNGTIARTLVVSEGTVKFHVKNILRKLHAANRAEATSRYLRLTLGRNLPS